MKTSDFKRDDWLVIGLAVVLAIDLIVLPWFSFSIGPYSSSEAATSAPDGFLGVLAFLLALAVAVDLVVERSAPQTTLPNIGGSRTMTRWWLTVAAAVLLVLLFLFHIHFNYFGFGFYLAVILTAGLVFVTRKLSKDQPVMPTA
jgi:predicted Abi (CAAX) family protease